MFDQAHYDRRCAEAQAIVDLWPKKDIYDRRADIGRAKKAAEETLKDPVWISEQHRRYVREQ